MLFFDESSSSCDSSNYDYFSDTDSSTSSNDSYYVEDLLYYCDKKNVPIIKNAKKIKNVKKNSKKLQLLEKNKRYDIYYDKIHNLINFIKKK